MTTHSHSAHARNRRGWWRTALAGLALVALVAPAAGSAAAASPQASSARRTVIVRAVDADQAAVAVTRLGGEVGRPLGIIGGFVASVPADRIDDLAAAPSVAAVTPDAGLRFHSDDAAASGGTTLATALDAIGADDLHAAGNRGQNVDVALIDSGVAPVAGLTEAGKIVNGPDLSFDSQADNLRHLDTYGHGTHLAGIIGADGGGVTGVAPDARILSVKVADASGNSDVSQVIAAIDWVVQHRRTNGLNVRVLNLAFGTDGTQSAALDPLSFAVEVAWRRAGIVTVVSAGNRGAAGLTNPARNPWIIAVGAADTKGTTAANDDVVSDFSGVGDGVRNPDVVAPGKSIVSLRTPESALDQAYPAARVGASLFKGSGTSQSAAFVSGAAALLLSQNPGWSADQVKAALSGSARKLPGTVPATQQGAGLVQVDKAVRRSDTGVTQKHAAGSGTGTLEGARGTYHLIDRSGVELRGEIDIMGSSWSGSSWSGWSWSGSSWSGGTWNGSSWSGSSWSGSSWSGSSWSGSSWSGSSWSGSSWSGSSWSSNTWNGSSWSGSSWSGSSWSGSSWSGSSWSGSSWSVSNVGGTPWGASSWS